MELVKGQPVMINCAGGCKEENHCDHRDPPFRSAWHLARICDKKCITPIVEPGQVWVYNENGNLPGRQRSEVCPH
jgi:hypothetical protein